MRWIRRPLCTRVTRPPALASAAALAGGSPARIRQAVASLSPTGPSSLPSLAAMHSLSRRSLTWPETERENVGSRVAETESRRDRCSRRVEQNAGPTGVDGMSARSFDRDCFVTGRGSARSLTRAPASCSLCDTTIAGHNANRQMRTRTSGGGLSPAPTRCRRLLRPAQRRAMLSA